jgi:hypothetical protein
MEFDKHIEVIQPVTDEKGNQKYRYPSIYEGSLYTENCKVKILKSEMIFPLLYM